MFEKIQAGQHVAIRLPSEAIRVEHITPNALINLGKYGSFRTTSIIGRPYHLTFEILDRAEQINGKELRIVRASEIHAETLLEEAEPDVVEDAEASDLAKNVDEYGLPTTNEKSNVNIVDHPSNQKLTYQEIEALKSDEMANPKEVIAKIMANHSQIDQKTAFSLAKYMLRKHKKYMKRFTVLPLDITTLTTYMMNEKDFSKVLEMRTESLGLITSWANVHASLPRAEGSEKSCRYLVVDDTGGLMVGAIAEKMGLLHHTPSEHVTKQDNAGLNLNGSANGDQTHASEQQTGERPRRVHYTHDLATSNAITLVHGNQQPNLSLLRYFSFDPAQPPTSTEASPHPLHTHLHALTWLQLLQPETDATYANQPVMRTPEELSKMKANHRSTYYRKQRRWQRTKQIVDTARAGDFDALIIAGFTDAVTICKHLVPLLKGGAQVVIYSPQIEPLMEVCDVYSTARRTAYLNEMKKRSQRIANGTDRAGEETVNANDNMDVDGDEEPSRVADDVTLDQDVRFPVDPTLLLSPSIHHSCARPWQVLPGRTHPLMIGKGGAEGGYVMVSTRVIPIQGVIAQARGRQGRRTKKRTLEEVDSQGTPSKDGALSMSEQDVNVQAVDGNVEEKA